MSTPTIALEEHFLSSPSLSFPNAAFQRFLSAGKPIWGDKLADVSADGARMQAMNAGEVSMQVLSHVCGVTSCTPDEVQLTNDDVARSIRSQPRYRSFAALPMKYPTAAASELQRCVQELGFVGAMIDSHTDDGRYYDDSSFWEVFAMAEKLNVPMYIHPVLPTEAVNKVLFEGNYGPKTQVSLGMAGWGWHSDAALSLLRMYASGLFDRFPSLQVVIGHMGEMIPFMLERIDEVLGLHSEGLTTTFRTVWDRNVFITTSGMFSLSPMACVLHCTQPDRIMYAVDYPFADTERGAKFLKELKASGLVTDEQYAMIAYKNAERLLKIKA